MKKKKLFRYSKGGVIKKPDYTGMGIDFMNRDKSKPLTPYQSNGYIPQSMLPTTGDKIHNALSDVATGVLTWGTGLRKPTPQELEAGRMGWPERQGLDYVKIKNTHDGGYGDVSIINHKPGNYLKSLVGNNGMFDMKNPNIYKGVALPVGVGLAAKKKSSREEYGMGGILQGVGSMFGSIPVIGGFVEGAFGLMGKAAQGFEDTRLAREAKEQQHRLSAQGAQMSGQGSLLAGAQSKYLDTFPYGGMVPGQTPVELEKQEVYQTPDGMMGQVDGPSHGQGGIDMSLPGGTFVWSDKLKTSNGSTFAEEAARLGKLKAKYEKILNS